MGKASSAKKVARAARAGGRVSARQPRGLLFPGVLTLVVVLGLALVVYARDDRRSDDLGGVPQLGDHIHQALGVNVCGQWLQDLPEFESPVGIHTHGDGVLHIHPFSQLGVGANATLGRYFDDAADEGGLEVGITNSKLDWLGKTYEEGDTTCDGVDDPILRVAYWADINDPDLDPEVTSGGFGDLRLTADGAAFTIFYGDRDADIPRPPHAPQLEELGARDGGQTPNSQGETTTTQGGEPTGSTIVPSGGDSSTTTESTTTAP